MYVDPTREATPPAVAALVERLLNPNAPGAPQDAEERWELRADAAAALEALARERDAAKSASAELWNICTETLNELPRIVDTTSLVLRARAVVAERDALRARVEELERAESAELLATEEQAAKNADEVLRLRERVAELEGRKS